MKGLKKQRRVQILALAGVCIAGVLAILWFLPKDAFQFFRTPTEVLADPPRENEFFQLGGLVKEGSMTQPTGTQFSFLVTDGENDMRVDYVGSEPRPDLFNEGQGTIVKGYYVNGVFQASELLAKHDETYMPAELDFLKEQGVYQDPNG